ncbi:MAG: hypothetical protein ACJA1H_000369 [Glaciecola sp.]|jgi:hypothetical protein
MKAQQPVSVHLTQKDGLPDKEFYNIIEDSKGFIWLCADKGLFRYDGKTFENYSNKDKRALSVFGVKEDNQGRIWSNNITGQFFYVESNKLYTFIDLSKQLKGELAEFEIVDNALLVFGQRKIYKVDLETKEIEIVYTPKSSVGGSSKIDDVIYFGTLDSIISLKSKNNIEQLFPTKLRNRKKNGRRIISGKSKIFKLDSLLFYRQIRDKKNVFFYIDLSKKNLEKIDDFDVVAKERIRHIFESDNEIWISTSNGVWIYERLKDGFQLKKRFLNGKDVTKIIKDKDDNYWFTTLNDGIYIMPNIYIVRYPISQEHKNISCLDKVNDSTLHFGSNSGSVGFYNIKTNVETLLEVPENSRVSAIKYNSKKQVSYIAKDYDGFLLDHRTLKLKRVKNYFAAKSFSVLDNQDVLCVNYNTVRVLEKGEVNNMLLLFRDRRPYTSYYSHKKKSVYISYVDGLAKYDSLWNAKTIHYKNEPIYGLSITETTNGLIWVATFKNGVFGIKDGEAVSHFTTKNGLVSNKIEKIKGDGNKLWIATDSGIQLLDTYTQDFKILTKRDGVVSYDISGIEIIEDKVIFSSNEGLFAFNKKKVFKEQKPLEVYFNNIEINEGKSVIKSNYKLKHDQNTIKMGFNVNGFQFNQKGKYTYRLLGLNKNWITTEVGVNSVKYNSLSAGNYTFQVQPVLDVESNEIRIEALQFSIERPFWKTWWFISGLSILVLGSTVLYFRRKIKKKEQQRELEVKQLSLDKELIALKLENLRSQMNPHFIFNALNSIQEYIVLNQKKLASEYLGKFADLIRTYLNHSTKGKITLQEEIDCLEMYLELEKLRFEEKLHYTIATSGNLKPEQVNIPTMLIQPYVENALKHGLLHRKTDRVLKINFFINDEVSTVRCIIIDNGVGREKAEEFKVRSHKTHKSFATKATQDRLALLNYGKQKQVGVDITDIVENENPVGTQVDITIPYTTH